MNFDKKHPVYDFKDKILDLVDEDPVTILTAETGAGKSTQVTQYLLYAGYSVISTQPRRIAAISLSEHVAFEWGTNLGDEVGYNISRDKKSSQNTELLFVTDGLQLVRELVDRKSKRNRVLIIDEVHEWNINIETLVAWVKEKLKTDKNLKVVLMSATIESDRLSKFFDNAPVISIPGRLFPIETRKKGASIELDVQKLVNEGRNVLVFLPGKAEIEDMTEKLESLKVKAKILPLHSELSSDDQKKCFKEYVNGKVILSTTIAQTSVTIPDVSAVVDSGYERRAETVNGIEGLYTRPISIADSQQRRGRAGRTSPGVYIDHCDVSSKDRLPFPLSEIERVRLDKTILRLLMLDIDMEKFEFFHLPDRESISIAKKSLEILGCIDANGKVTTIGKIVSNFPVSVQYGRMIYEANKLGVVSDVVLAAAILECGEINFRKDKDGYPTYKWRRLVSRESGSDLLAQMELYRLAENMSYQECLDNEINPKVFDRVTHIYNHIIDFLERHDVNTDSTGNREDVITCICAGMIENIYSVRIGKFISKGQMRDQSRDTVVRLPRTGFVVGVPFDLEIPKLRMGVKVGTMKLELVRMVTVVTSEQIEKAAPHLTELKSGLNPRVNNEGKVYTTTEKRIGEFLISQVEEISPGHPMEISEKSKKLFDNFKFPIMKILPVDIDMTVPNVREMIIGYDERSKSNIIAYGYYKKSKNSLYLDPKWTLNKNEARDERSKAVNHAQLILANQDLHERLFRSRTI